VRSRFDRILTDLHAASRAVRSRPAAMSASSRSSTSCSRCTRGTLRGLGIALLSYGSRSRSTRSSARGPRSRSWVHHQPRGRRLPLYARRLFPSSAGSTPFAAPLQVALLTRDDTAVDDRDRDRQRDERPGRIRDDRDPIRERHAEVARFRVSRYGPSVTIESEGEYASMGVRARPKARTNVPISRAPATINAAPTGRATVDGSEASPITASRPKPTPSTPR